MNKILAAVLLAAAAPSAGAATNTQIGQIQQGSSGPSTQPASSSSVTPEQLENAIVSQARAAFSDLQAQHAPAADFYAVENKLLAQYQAEAQKNSLTVPADATARLKQTLNALIAQASAPAVDPSQAEARIQSQALQKLTSQINAGQTAAQQKAAAQAVSEEAQRQISLIAGATPAQKTRLSQTVADAIQDKLVALQAQYQAQSPAAQMPKLAAAAQAQIAAFVDAHFKSVPGIAPQQGFMLATKQKFDKDELVEREDSLKALFGKELDGTLADFQKKAAATPASGQAALLAQFQDSLNKLALSQQQRALAAITTLGGH